MSSEKYECPVCGKMFPQSSINSHVDLCLKQTEIVVPTKRKSSTNLESVEQLSQPLKRLKNNSPSSDTGKNGNSSKTERSQTETLPEKIACHYAQKVFSPDNSMKMKNAYAKMFQPKNKQSPEKANLCKNESSKTSVSMSASSSTVVNVQKSYPNNKTVKSSTVFPSQQASGRLTKQNVPLAEMMRPATLDDYIGQDHVVGDGKMLRKLLESVKLPSMILWGPPGCGKTTLAAIVAKKCKEACDLRFVKLSATTSGVSDVKEAIKVAKNDMNMFKRKTVLFIDEIHRFNKLQQDTFLPHVEDGTITLIGATTENPSFQVNNALLSRCKVIVLEKLTTESLQTILDKGLKKLGITRVHDGKEVGNGCDLYITDAAVEMIAGFSDGDARGALNALETVYQSKVGSSEYKPEVIEVECVKEVMQRTHVQYDRQGDEHYHCASALQKSVRGSDDNGALYWMTRMLEGGEDPLFVARRLVVTASEDIGLADPQALPLAMATYQACQVIGRPECFINLSHCTTYLARAPKSNECISALHAAQRCIKEHIGPLPGVPLHLRNASTKLMKQLGYGKGYKYSHAGGSEAPSYLPDELAHMDFYN